MIATLQFIVLLFALGSLVYFRLKPLIWTPLAAVILLVFTIGGQITWPWLIGVWALFVFLAVAVNYSKASMALFVKPIFKYMRHQLPAISKTEQEALDAGDVWWESELCQGKPAWRKLLAMTKPSLTSEEQAFLDNEVEQLCRMLDDWQITQYDLDLPETVWRFLKDKGFFGMLISKSYGGLGFSALAQSTVVGKVASRSVSASVVIMVPNSLGPGELLEHYGTEEQKKFYLPRLAKGEEIPCFALTAPDAGSDAASLSDTGIICRGEHEGKTVLGIRLNWDKRYISLAPIATFIGVAFKAYDPEGLLGHEKALGITVCLVPATHPGVTTGLRHYPLSTAFPNGPTQGKDVFIPLEWVIGGPASIGKGWQMLMECLAIGRGISLPALNTAFAKLCYRTTGAYARIRKQFNLPIGYFEGVEEGLAQIGGFTYLLEATRLMTASAVDQRFKPTLASAIAKCHMSELGRKIINAAMDIHAGKAIQLGPKNYLGRSYQAVPISITVEGANILTRNLIIFGQGILRAHPYLRQEMAALSESDEDQAMKRLEPLLLAHTGYIASHFMRSLFYGLTGGLLIFTPVRGKTRRYYAQLTRMSTALAFCADVTLAALGGQLKRRERLSARLGDVLSHLYLASSALLYYEQNGRCKEDLPTLTWSLDYCLFEMQTALEDCFNNFPSRALADLMRITVFPYGRPYRKPTDAQSHLVARQMMQPSAFRERLTAYCFIGDNANDPVWQLEDALEQVIRTDPIHAKLKDALRQGVLHSGLDFATQLANAEYKQVLSPEEASALLQAMQVVQSVVAVDAFTHEQLQRGK